MALQGYASMGRMNANLKEGYEYEKHRFCSHHGCSYSGTVDSRLREWATKRDIHIHIFILVRNATTTNHIDANHIHITTTTNYHINSNHICITTATNYHINSNHQDEDTEQFIGNKSPRY
ncbi:MAG: hypothetical protein EHM14_06505 [Methanothrix sp.]|nr:MAG: hypothetical protein EHM14_06505 [Methanothrix sp.]